MSKEKINWDDPDIDKILWKGFEDLDKKEGFYKDSNIPDNKEKIKNKVLKNIENKSFRESLKIIENEKNIKIKCWNDNWWFIEFYSNANVLIWKIWNDWYELEPGNIDNNHLWIEIYWEFQWKGFSKLLYDLYYKYSLENTDIIYPDYDLAQSNSRINLLIKLWYKLKEIFINWYFLELSEYDKINIINDIENNYYWKQWNTIKLEKDNFD